MRQELSPLRQMIEAYVPVCTQEARDREIMLQFLDDHDDCLCRTCLTGHFTASAWIVNPSRNKVLMIYHNIYDSWAWTGGHADGDPDLLTVALREAEEETGVTDFRLICREPVSLEILTVDGHTKKGVYVPSHLHMNLTFMFEAEESGALRIKADENSGVAWIETEDVSRRVSEAWMNKWIYSKLEKRYEHEEN